LFAGSAASVYADDAVISPTPGVLMMRAGSFATATLPDLLPAAKTFVSGRAYVLAFDGPMTPERRDGLSAAGVVLSEYLPTDCFIAMLGTVKPADLRLVPGLKSVHDFDPAWKVSPTLGRPAADADLAAVHARGKWPVMISLFSGMSPEDTLASLREIPDFEIVSISEEGGSWLITGAMAPATQAAVAALDGVHFIDDAPEITLRNATASGVVQSGVAAQSPLHANGLTGLGSIVGIIDGMPQISHCSFLDAVNPVGPLHRKVEAMNGGNNPSFHGTHVAGSVLGNAGVAGDTRGIAYNARMVYNLYPAFNEASTYARFDLHHNQGAFIHSNSWGNDNTTAYDAISRGVDNFSWVNDDNLVCYSVSNGAVIKNPENAKNCLAVAASGDSGSVQNYCIGGRGPTTDGRRKPEVMAPGCSIRSADAFSTCSAASSTGTSMACPLTAGLGVLVREYFANGYYPSGAANAPDAFTPTGALLKAALINSATDMSGIAGFPSNQEGWGRVLGDDVLMFPGDARKLIVAQAFNADVNARQTGQSFVLRVRVTDNSIPLKITMAFHDAPGAVSTSFAPVNNLDLEATPLIGASFLGNVFSGGVSTPGGTSDAINNVEQILVPSPQVGAWLVKISAPAVNVGTQGYGLVITGGVATLCPADFNGDGFVDFFDYDSFVEAFEAGNPFADFNADGFIDFFDYDGYVEAFEVGC
jgi:hypothetical protein